MNESTKMHILFIREKKSLRVSATGHGIGGIQTYV